MAENKVGRDQNHIVQLTIDYLTGERTPVGIRHEEYRATHQNPDSEDARSEELVTIFSDELPRHWNKFHDQLNANDADLAYKSLRKMAVIANHGAVLIGMRISRSVEDNFKLQGSELDLAKETLKESVDAAVFDGSFESALAPIDFCTLGQNEIQIVSDKSVIKASIRMTQLLCQFALQHGIAVNKM